MLYAGTKVVRLRFFTMVTVTAFVLVCVMYDGGVAK